jgi:hypothetical protein
MTTAKQKLAADKAKPKSNDDKMPRNKIKPIGPSVGKKASKK